MNIKVQQLTGVLLSMVLLCLFNACGEEREMEMATGDLQISLAKDWVDVTSSRATPAELGKPVQEQFHLKVTKQDTKNVVHDGAFRSYFRTLTPGEYTLEATYGENKVLDWDAPYYAGSVEAEVTNGGSTQATIPVSVKNALMSVKFTNPEIFGQIYSQYGLEVKVPTNSGSSSLTIWSDMTEKSAYFRAGTEGLEVTFVGTTIEGGKKVSYSLTESLANIIPLQAAEHAKIKLTAANTGINVEKVEVEIVTVDETLPMEWLPIPKVASTTGFTNNSITFTETERKETKIEYFIASPIQEAKIEFNFYAPQYPELMSMNGIYTLSTITQEQRTALQNMGITLPAIGSTTCQVDLTGVTERMQTDNGISTTNTVTINVRANNRWSDGDKEQGTGDMFTMTVVKPTLSDISVPVGDVWSKQFQITETTITGGNQATLNAGLKYQYSSDGGTTWKDCSNGSLQQFSSHPAEKNYVVRAAYFSANGTNVIATNTASLTLENPTNVPNGNMDAWTATTRAVKIQLGSTKYQPYYYPWNDNISAWWDTNSAATMPTSTSTSNLNYKCFPTAAYIEPGNNGTGKAAVIRTISVNWWNTGGTSLGDNIRGVIYAGSSDNSGNMTEGRSFTDRPTKMSFYYKYESYDNERFGAYIELYNGTTRIADGTYLSTNGQSITSWTKQEVAFNYSDETLKATSIRIKFTSVAEGDKPAVQTGKDITIPAGNYNVHAGSALTIDDISLIYDK